MSARNVAAASAVVLALAATSATSTKADATRGRESPPADEVPRAPRRVHAPPTPQRFVEEPVAGRGATWAVRGGGQSVFVSAREARVVREAGARGVALAMEFVGAREDARIEPTEIEAARVNRLRGPRAQWKTGLRMARTLATRNAWPGVDVRWETGAGRAKYAFVVAPGADASQATLRWTGADSVRVDASGDLVVATALGEIRDERPTAWTESAAGRAPVDVRWVVASDAKTKSATVSFALGARDPDATLVIDPSIVVSSGFVGGSGLDEAYCVAADAAGAAYVAGMSKSTDLPTTVGAFDTTLAGAIEDAFIAKVKPDGSGFVYLTFLGGSDYDAVYGIAVDSQGRAVVGGESSTSDGSFPVVGGLDASHNGGADGFVGRLSADGSSLDWCGFLGGSGGENVNAVGVDETGAVYACGETESAETTFPATVGPDLVFNGVTDAFVAKVKADGSALVFCGYVGGAARDAAYGIAVATGGVAVLAGRTQSTEATFPVVGGLDSTQNGGTDGFVARVKADGSALDLCGYVGGAADDSLGGVDVDTGGNIYACGYATSSEATLPVVGGPDLTHAGGMDGVVAKISPTGALFYCGYVGGADTDSATDVEVDAQGRAVVVGYARSNETTDGFPVAVGPDLTQNGDVDAWAATVKADGSGFVSLGYLGGDQSEQAWSVAVAPTGAVWVVGQTKSTEATFPVRVGPDLAQGGGGENDGFIARLWEPASESVAVDSFLAVKRAVLRKNAAKPEKSRLVVTGNLDLGTDVLVPADAAHVTINGTAYDFATLGEDKNGKGFRLKSDVLDVRVRYSPKGSSACSFSLTLTGAAAAAIDAGGMLDVGFANGVMSVGGSVALTAGAYRLGKPGGKLDAPNLYPASIAGTVKGAGKDTLTLRLGFATDGTTPAAAPKVEIAFGALRAYVDSASFVRRGDRWTFKGPKTGVTQVILDYAAEKITVVAKKADLGPFPDASNPVEIHVALDDVDRSVRVLVGRKGVALKY